jgi:hypothetical protein
MTDQETPTLMEQLVAKIAECEEADRASSAVDERAWKIRMAANKLRAQILIAEAVKYLGPFQWSVRFPGKDTCALEADRRVGGYDEAFSDLASFVAFAWEHDSFEVAEGVSLRADDGELRIMFETTTRMVEFMQEVGLTDRIRIQELTFLIDTRRKAAKAAIADAETLEAVRDALFPGERVSDSG